MTGLNALTGCDAFRSKLSPCRAFMGNFPEKPVTTRHEAQTRHRRQPGARHGSFLRDAARGLEGCAVSPALGIEIAWPVAAMDGSR